MANDRKDPPKGPPPAPPESRNPLKQVKAHQEGSKATRTDHKRVPPSPPHGPAKKEK
jgi:hypothetical protein